MAEIPTSQRLLEAAGEVFARVGFRSATVREICERAGANVASVNYHFGDKEKLYSEVFKYVHQVDIEGGRSLSNLNLSGNPKDLLKTFIEGILQKMLLPGKFSWKGQLLAREMAEPSPVLDEIISFWIRPISEVLNQIVAQLLELPVDDERVRLAAMSVFGQCFFHKHGHAVNTKLYPDLKYTEESVKTLAEHVYLFSVGGLTVIKGAKL